MRLSSLSPITLALALPLSLLLIAGCESDRPKEVIERPDGPTKVEIDRKEVDRLIGDLTRGKDPSKIEDAKVYDAAVNGLIRKGSAIESQLIDHLRRSTDWAQRLGLVEVLQAVGSKACIEHLIFVLADEEPLVAYRANTSLQELCQHREIPEKAPIGANGLPPVPPRPERDLELDAELRIWTAWHNENKTRLRDAWTAWWAANRDTVVIR